MSANGGEIPRKDIDAAMEKSSPIDRSTPRRSKPAKCAERAEFQPPAPAFDCGAVIVNMANVKPERVDWLWRGRIAIGKLTLLAGDPGLGKSFVTMDVAARVTTGAPWPDDLDAANKAGGVVLLSAEDDAADTIRPRLDAAGADVSRVNHLQAVRVRTNYKAEPDGLPRLVEVSFDLTRDLPQLESTIEKTPDCRLVVIDPISAYLGGIDSHNNTAVRGQLAPLAQLASKRRVAVLAVTHLNKNAGGPVMYRSMGSLAFAAAARGVLVVTKDPNDPSRRLVLPVKNNLASDVLGMAYRIVADELGDLASVAWVPEPVEISAEDALAADRSQNHEESDAASWLRETLSGGKVPANEILSDARVCGFGEKAMRNARKTIGAKIQREGYGSGGTSYWVMPGPIVGIDGPFPEGANNGKYDGEGAGESANP